MTDNLLTSISEKEQKLAEAEQNVRRARNALTRLKSEVTQSRRNLAATQKIVLGAALLRFVESNPQHLPTFRRAILPNVTRPTDLAALTGTPFDPSAVPAEGAV